MNNGELLTANPAGHTLVDKLEEVLKGNKALEKQVVALEKQVVALEKQVVALTEGNKTLTRRSDDLMQASSDLRAIRNRFLDQYRQHKQSLPFKLVRSSIRAGNRAAHDPDIIFDALLYVNRHRSDPDTFKSLYGITPTKALDIRDKGRTYIISALEAFAKKESERTTTANVNSKFLELIHLVNTTTDLPSSADPNTPVGRAYFGFFSAVNKR